MKTRSSKAAYAIVVVILLCSGSASAWAGESFPMSLWEQVVAYFTAGESAGDEPEGGGYWLPNGFTENDSGAGRQDSGKETPPATTTSNADDDEGGGYWLPGG